MNLLDIGLVTAGTAFLVLSILYAAEKIFPPKSA